MEQAVIVPPVRETIRVEERTKGGPNFGSIILAVIFVFALAAIITAAAYKGKKVKAKQRKNDQKFTIKQGQQNAKNNEKNEKRTRKNRKGQGPKVGGTKNNNLTKTGGGGGK